MCGCRLCCTTFLREFEQLIREELNALLETKKDLIVKDSEQFYSEKLKDILQIKEDFAWESHTNNEEFLPGHEIGKPEILFQKIEDGLIQTEIGKLNR